MKSRFFTYCIVAASLLSACGDDSSTSPSTNTGDANVSSSSVSKEPTSSAKENNESSTSSSDSKEASSSSAENNSNEKSSSSNADVKGSPANYNPETGILTDERDGEVYKTAKIGDQIWMAENLNFDIKDYKNTIITDLDELMGENNGYKNETRCPKSSTEDDCNQYGRLYTQIGFLLSLNDKRVYKAYPSVDESLRPYQGVCPTGWHIPSLDEWQTLFDNAYLNELISVEDGGDNKSGFNVKLIGFAHKESNVVYEKSPNYNNEMASFATVDDANAEKFTAIWVKKNDANTLTADKKLHYAVRCLMN